MSSNAKVIGELGSGAGTTTSETSQSRRRRSRPGISTAIGGFYLAMAGVNTGLAIGNAAVYRHFADHGLFGFVRTGWADIVMANPALWAALLAASEACVGVFLLVGGTFAKWGWVGVLVFHALLLLFGWGDWAYAVPALVIFGVLARHDWNRL